MHTFLGKIMELHLHQKLILMLLKIGQSLRILSS